MKCTFHAPQATRPLCWGIACCTVWFYFPFGVLLPYLCSDLVYSLYFNDDTTQVLEQVRQAMDANDARNEASLRYVEALPLRNTSVDTSGAFDVTVAIVTRNRGWSGITKNLQLGYLTQTFASVHRAAADSRLRVKLFVCNVDAQPDTFREASALHEHVHTFTKYSSKTAHIPEDLYEKQKQDYSDCLKHSAATWRSQYVVMFEDDVYLSSQHGTQRLDKFVHTLIVKCNAVMLDALLVTLIREMRNEQVPGRSVEARDVTRRFMRSVVRIFVVLSVELAPQTKPAKG